MIEIAEALSSDEDEVDENNTSYLDNIKNFATKKASQGGFEMSAEIKVNLNWWIILLLFKRDKAMEFRV